MNQDMVPYKYIGPYGTRSSPARAEGIGKFYQGEVVMVPKSLQASLPRDQWLRADNLCQYEKLDGKICGSPDRLPGSPFCRLHHEEVIQAAEEPEPIDEGFADQLDALPKLTKKKDKKQNPVIRGVN